MDLFSSVTELRGIGPTRAKQLQRLHIETLYDLIAFFPRAYEDRTKISSIAGLEPGIPACFEAMVISNPQLSRIRKGMELGRTCGVFGEPAGVTGTAAVKKACELGLIGKDDTVVSVVTGNGLKDVANAIKSAGEPINIKPDLDLMVSEFAKRGVTVE